MLKEKLNEPTFKIHEFKEGLSNEEIEILKILDQAQRKQGNLKRLEATFEKLSEDLPHLLVFQWK